MTAAAMGIQPMATTASAPAIPNEVVGGYHSLSFYASQMTGSMMPPTVTKVVWQVDGAAQYSPYYYSKPKGLVTLLPNPFTQQMNNAPNGSNVSLSWAWDGEARIHTISWTVYFSDGSTTSPSAPLQVNVVRPNVTSFTDAFQKLDFSDGQFTLGGGQFMLGFHQGVSSLPGDVFSATVDTTNMPTGGYFAVQEMISFKMTYNTFNQFGQPLPLVRQGGTADSKVLDDPPSKAWSQTPDAYTVFTLNYVTPYVQSGVSSTAIPITGDKNPELYSPPPQGMNPPGQGLIADSPYLAQIPFTPAWTDLSLDMNYDVYLMYASSMGFWVTLSKMSFSLQGSKHFDGVRWADSPPPAAPGLPQLPAQAPTPEAAGTLSGTTTSNTPATGSGFLSWTDYMTNRATPTSPGAWQDVTPPQ